MEIGQALTAGALEASLSIEPTGTGCWAAVASPQYEANTGMFGGWTAALLLKAVLSEADAVGSASAMTVNFVNRVVPGTALEVRTKQLGGGRSITHWRSEVMAEGRLLATAIVVLADRKSSDQHSETTMPMAPLPASVQPTELPGTFGAVVEARPTLGDSLFNQAVTRSLNWERDLSGRPMDAVQIALLSDLGAPRIWFVSNGPRPSSTITLSIYFHATDNELAACEDDYVLSEMVATRANAATIGSRKDLWSRDGTLLATSEQLCWFR